MAYDISKSIPQGDNGEETEENLRILEVANELHRRCELYEAQLQDGQANGSLFEVEQHMTGMTKAILQTNHDILWI